jgi:hypothetical protein
MSDHKESLEQVVKRVEASFAKIEQHDKKAVDFRISAGKLLVELKGRIESGEAGKGVQWWSWYAEHFDRSRRDANRVMRLASSDDPEKAAEEDRKKAREGMKRLRSETNNGDVSPDVQPGSAPDEDNPASWDEMRIAESIARDVEDEIAERSDKDQDLIRELVVSKIQFKPTSDVPAEPAKEMTAPPSKRGRNKPKATPEPAGNTGDAEAEVEAQKAENAAKFDEEPTSATTDVSDEEAQRIADAAGAYLDGKKPAPTDDLDIRNMPFYRGPETGAAA